MSKDFIRVSKEQALKIVEGISDSQIHCFTGSIGADWKKKDVISAIKDCQKITWIKNIFNHNLAIIDKEGHQWNFDISHKAFKK